tara:strand:+ start:496 stop:861 length:366 start_codon:yes stop_codon:yes gene_type:complete
MFFKTHIRWVDLISEKNFAENYIEGNIIPIKVEEEDCLSVKIKEALKVFEKNCPHQKSPLINAVCDGDEIICPWHKYSFNLDSGRDMSTSGNALKVYKTKLEEGIWKVGVEIKLPFWMDPI